MNTTRSHKPAAFRAILATCSALTLLTVTGLSLIHI